MILSTFTVIVVIAVAVTAYTLYTQNVFKVSSAVSETPNVATTPNPWHVTPSQNPLPVTPSQSPLPVNLQPVRIPRYRLPDGRVLEGPDKELGRGAFGTVGRYKLDGQSMAVKMPNDLSQNEFQRHELTILRKANPHTNIISYIGEYNINGKIAIVLELMKGSVRDLLDNLPHLSWLTKLSLARQMTMALTHLHKLNSEGLTRQAIVHQDLKSDNLLVDNIEDSPNIKLKITDFGVAREIEQVSIPVFGKRTSKMLAGKEAGTLLYMAPEVIKAVKKGKHICDTKSDMYSSGLIFWELATGRRPIRTINDICEGRFPEFDSDKQRAVQSQSLLRRGSAMFDKPTYRQSSFFGPIINKCIKLKPSDRDSASKVLERLEAISI